MKKVQIMEATNGFVIQIEEEQDITKTMEQLNDIKFGGQIDEAISAVGNLIHDLELKPKKQRYMVAQDKEGLLKIIESLIAAW